MPGGKHPSNVSQAQLLPRVVTYCNPQWRAVLKVRDPTLLRTRRDIRHPCRGSYSSLNGHDILSYRYFLQVSRYMIPDLVSTTLQSFSCATMAAPLVVPALRKHTATVIWAHGLGDRYADGLLFGAQLTSI